MHGDARQGCNDAHECDRGRLILLRLVGSAEDGLPLVVIEYPLMLFVFSAVDGRLNPVLGYRPVNEMVVKHLYSGFEMCFGSDPRTKGAGVRSQKNYDLAPFEKQREHGIMYIQ